MQRAPTFDSNNDDGSDDGDEEQSGDDDNDGNEDTNDDGAGNEDAGNPSFSFDSFIDENAYAVVHSPHFRGTVVIAKRRERIVGVFGPNNDFHANTDTSNGSVVRAYKTTDDMPCGIHKQKISKNKKAFKHVNALLKKSLKCDHHGHKAIVRFTGRNTLTLLQPQSCNANVNWFVDGYGIGASKKSLTQVTARDGPELTLKNCRMIAGSQKTIMFQEKPCTCCLKDDIPGIPMVEKDSESDIAKFMFTYLSQVDVTRGNWLLFNKWASWIRERLCSSRTLVLIPQQAGVHSCCTK